MRSLFDQFDTDGGNSMDINELRSFLIKTGQDPTDEELRTMMLNIDVDGNGTIEFNEFITYMVEQKQKRVAMLLGSAFDDLISQAPSEFDTKMLNQS